MVLQAVAIVLVYQVSPVLSNLKGIKKRGKFSWCTACPQSGNQAEDTIHLYDWKFERSSNLFICPFYIKPPRISSEQQKKGTVT